MSELGRRSRDERAYRQAVPSTARVVVYSLLASFSVLAVSFALQRLVYHDWLHYTGQIHVVGTTIAAIITFAFVLSWHLGVRRAQIEARRRFELIAQMADRIRNAVQAIECLTYASDPDSTKAVRDAVQVIDAALRGVVAESRPAQHSTKPPQNPAGVALQKSQTQGRASSRA